MLSAVVLLGVVTGLVQFIILAAVAGLVVWLVTSYLPIPEPIRTVIIVVVALALLIAGLHALGIW